MDLTYATIVVLASMMFVLSGMVGYLYWQQTRLQQSIQSLSLVVSSLVNPPALESEPESEPQSEAESERAPAPTAEPSPVSTEDEEDEEEDEEDDRVSVEHVTESPRKESAAQPLDIDDLQTKTAVQLREILTQKGIPFGKRDSKTVLIELLKATA
jgi:cytoskeletal protein RodZ